MTSGRSLVAALAMAMVLASTAGAADPCADGGRLTPISADGIGGTGVLSGGDDEEPQGIGGTGFIDGDPDEGGIGGTGIERRADSAVVGVVTGFASICVGGREIHYDGETAVSVDGVAAAASSLAVGQVVEVAAADARALRIQIRHEVEGQVAAVDEAGNRISVLGQSVALDAATWTSLDDGPGAARASMFRVGDAVRVSGFRDDDGAIVASRVEALENAVPTLRGAVEQVGEDRLVVAGVPVTSEAGVRLGDQVRVEGSWDGARLDARSVVVESALPSMVGIERVQVEGIARRPASAAAGQLVIDGLPIDAGRIGQAPPIGQRVRVDATLRNGIAVAERIQTVRPRAPERPPRPQERPAIRPRGVDAPPARQGAPGRPPAAVAPDRARAAGGERPVQPRRPDGPDRVERPARPQRPERPAHPPRPPRPDRPIRPLPPPRP